MTTYTTTYKSPIGLLKISCHETAITEIYLTTHTSPHDDNSLLNKTCQELTEYFEGTRSQFDIPIELNGTNFQKEVWHELQNIPYGQTTTYGEIAKLIGKPKSARAVGGACNKNKILIINPCHRVIGSNGHLTGFAIGLAKKDFLLLIEKRN